MNHNTARCVGCNSIVQLPHLRARASAAKCEACARREAERVRELRSDEYAASPAQMTPRECFQRISHARCRRSDDVVEVSFMGELGIAKNTLTVPGAFVRTCFGEGYDVANLVGGEVRYEGVTGKVTGLSAGPDKWEQRARELTDEKRRDLLAFPDRAEYNAACDTEDACRYFLSYLGAFGGPDVYRAKSYRDKIWCPEAGSIPCKCGGWITPRFQHDTPGCGPKGVLAADGMGGLVDPYMVNSLVIFAAYSSNLSLHEQAKSAR